MQQLRNQPGIGAAALEFAILTAARSGEVRGALWPEINISERLWLIPADNEGRKGASNSAIRCSHSDTGTDERTSRVRFVFPGTKQDKSLSDMSLTAVLKRVEHGGLTVHGFRSTFRDWASETTTYLQEVCEMALAHIIANKVEAAYRRGDLFDKRIKLMADWGSYCNGMVAAIQS